MSPGDRAEGMARLRRAVAKIEAEAGPAARARRAAAAARRARSTPPSAAGSRATACTRSRRPSRADGAAAMGFALALAARFMAGGRPAALLIGRGLRAHETGALYGPGLVAHGLDLSAASSSCAPPTRRPVPGDGGGAQKRRAGRGRRRSLAAQGAIASPSRAACLLAARAGRTPALLILAGAYGAAERLSSAAETRFEIAAAPSASRLGGGRPAACPGRPAFAARLVKARLARPARDGPLRASMPARIIRLEWRSQDNQRGIGF